MNGLRLQHYIQVPSNVHGSAALIFRCFLKNWPSSVWKCFWSVELNQFSFQSICTVWVCFSLPCSCLSFDSLCIFAASEYFSLTCAFEIVCGKLRVDPLADGAGFYQVTDVYSEYMLEGLVASLLLRDLARCCSSLRYCVWSVSAILDICDALLIVSLSCQYIFCRVWYLYSRAWSLPKCCWHLISGCFHLSVTEMKKGQHTVLFCFHP